MSATSGDAVEGPDRPGRRPRSGALAPSRIAGVDLARGLAVLGMFAAHLLTIDAFDWSRPETWFDVANGRSSILFAMLAGVSLALVTGGATPVDGDTLALRRMRIAARAGLIWLIGVVLVLTGVPVYVILPAYAVLFLLALPLLSLRPPVLWALAVVLALVMPWVQPWLNDLPVWQGATGADLSLLLGWHYPFTTWAAFVVAGLAAGRSDPSRTATALLLLVGGSLGALLGYSAARLFPVPIQDGLAPVWTADAHSGGLFEVVGSGGFALAVLGASLLVCRTPLTWIVLPLRAVGSMPLTAYVGQIVAWAIAAALLLEEIGDLSGFRALDPLPIFVITTLVACTAWALLIGQGPMERLVAWASRFAASDPDLTGRSGTGGATRLVK